jgi:hypothetical protein
MVRVNIHKLEKRMNKILSLMVFGCVASVGFTHSAEAGWVNDGGVLQAPVTSGGASGMSFATGNLTASVQYGNSGTPYDFLSVSGNARRDKIYTFTWQGGGTPTESAVFQPYYHLEAHVSLPVAASYGTAKAEMFFSSPPYGTGFLPLQSIISTGGNNELSGSNCIVSIQASGSVTLTHRVLASISGKKAGLYALVRDF